MAEIIVVMVALILLVLLTLPRRRKLPVVIDVAESWYVVCKDGQHVQISDQNHPYDQRDIQPDPCMSQVVRGA